MYTQIWNKIEASESIVLISHIDPDGDALGSSLSLYTVLKKRGKKVCVVNVSSLAHYLDFLPNFNKVKQALPKSFDLMISFDCGSFDRLGIDKKEGFLINIDHHISNTLYGDIDLIESAASTSQVVYNLLEANNIEIDKEAAECIYTALVTDTGNFQYESVTARVFEIAKNLVECGVEPSYISQMLFERDPLSRLRFTAKALDSVELKLEGKLGFVTVTRQLLNETGAKKEDTDGIVNTVRKLATVEVAVMLREEETGIKVSFRSKTYVNVSDIAQKHGGGGHIRASGAFFATKDYEKIKAALTEEIKGCL